MFSASDINVHPLATFMGVDQRAGPGTNPRIPRVVSKSDRDHGTATTAHRTLGLTPAGTICHSNLSLSHYPIHKNVSVVFEGLRKGLKEGGGNKAIMLVPWKEKSTWY